MSNIVKNIGIGIMNAQILIITYSVVVGSCFMISQVGGWIGHNITRPVRKIEEALDGVYKTIIHP